ncbi:hypothetical protein TDB9533_02952 [Thalassocella blandensis]|nr:hypothetical protein TDB9533_02952 [Thalassocella blandensis]
MKSNSLEKILKFLGAGLYSGCVALVVESENRHQAIALLEKIGTERYSTY